jgi:hypothetical protein
MTAAVSCLCFFGCNARQGSARRLLSVVTQLVTGFTSIRTLDHRASQEDAQTRPKKRPEGPATGRGEGRARRTRILLLSYPSIIIMIHPPSLALLPTSLAKYSVVSLPLVDPRNRKAEKKLVSYRW